MVDQYGRYANVPIPSYDEATSHASSSSRNHRGPEEISDDAERQGLLGREGPQSAYNPPTVESPRSSEDSDLRLPEVTGEGDDERRRVEELDYLDPSTEDQTSRRSLYHRPRLRTKFSQHLSNLGATLSAIRLPSFRSFYAPVSTENPSDPPAPSRAPWLQRTTESWPTVPERYRMSLPTAARLFGLITIGVFVWALFALDLFPTNGRHLAMRYDPDSVRTFVQEKIDIDSIVGYLSHVTSYDHVAGTEGDLYMAEWMRERWEADGHFDEIKFSEYYVYLNYPKTDGSGRSVSIVSPQDKEWTAALEEDIIDPEKLQTYAWHGHSKSGEAEGHLVYANGGSREDFAWLQDQGVVLKGCIALIRYRNTQRDPGLKVKAAEEAGCVGALLFSDPKDDGSVRGKSWPEGPWRPEDSLQRAGVGLTRWVVGDPLTPGYASTLDVAVGLENGQAGLNGIPSLPLAWRDAKTLLNAMKGHGSLVPNEWVGGTQDFGHDWYSGNSTSGPDNAALFVHLANNLDENNKQHIWNLHGLIFGQESPDKKIVVGSHRDAWCFGSVDPGSGSAVLMELASIFGQLREHGWRPLRTIEFASWDAGEYNMAGSTEYVEDYMEDLRQHAYAYLNVGAGVYGPDQNFRAAGSPVWKRPLLHALGRVADPGSNATLGQMWADRNNPLDALGSEGDYVAFQSMAGVSSLDFGFEGAENGLPYHSCYENFDWMAKFGDVDFNYHKALAEVWALLILEVADRPLLPLDLRDYAEAIQGPYIDSLAAYAAFQGAETLDLTALRNVAQDFTDRAVEFHQFGDTWTTKVLGGGGLELNAVAIQRMQYNDAISSFERNLLDIPIQPSDQGPHGVPGREQYKHIIFGPQAWGGSDESFFPAVRDALYNKDWEQAQRMVDRAVEVLQLAVGNLHINLDD